MRRRRPTDVGGMDQLHSAGVTQTDPSPRAVRRYVYQNVVLTAIAGLLALSLMDRTSAGQPGLMARLMGPAQASAQSGETGELANALQQRKEMISELRQLNAKMDRLEAALAKGVNVKVTDMPALKLPPEMKGAESAKPGKSEKSDKPKDPPSISVKPMTDGK
jgi:hypothetical protein